MLIYHGSVGKVVREAVWRMVVERIRGLIDDDGGDDRGVGKMASTSHWIGLGYWWLM